MEELAVGRGEWERYRADAAEREAALQAAAEALQQQAADQQLHQQQPCRQRPRQQQPRRQRRMAAGIPVRSCCWAAPSVPQRSAPSRTPSRLCTAASTAASFTHS